MAILEVRDLIRAVSRDDALADLIVLASSMGFTANSWRIGSPDRFWLMALAEVASRCSVQIALQTAQGFNATAAANGLSKFSKSRFDNPRVKAIKTQGRVVLTDTAGLGPFTIATGSRVFKFDGDPSITYRNITGGTLSQGDTLAVTVEAETGGSAHNVAVNKITSMSPVIAGVSVNNPGNPTDWITRAGVDEQPDATLRDSNESKWATLGGSAPADAYQHWAINATQNVDGTGDPVGITRVAINDNNPGGPGTIYVYVANNAGTATGAQVTDVQEYINARKPRTAVPTVFAATTFPISVTGTFKCPAGLGATRKAQIETAIAAYINGLPIGGTDIGESLGAVVWSRLMEIAMRPTAGVTDVERVSITLPTGDVALQPNQVATVGTITFTASEI